MTKMHGEELSVGRARALLLDWLREGLGDIARGELKVIEVHAGALPTDDDELTLRDLLVACNIDHWANTSMAEFSS